MHEAQRRRGKSWGRREVYEGMIQMSSVASQKEIENAANEFWRMPNAPVGRWTERFPAAGLGGQVSRESLIL